ncbi:hypothetical protein MKW94_016025 [Papaver nudicaule]|uniref:Salutaridinol 7-O-acetyltransferase n=1 Tax=Papaver nudicaule TaxID=74823 RepID=A0AA42AY44_PAPNU|nr:hypothetical protein [Papaver nudicaule]
MSSAAVEVVSKETIKPTTTTSYQLRNFNLSLLDQYIPAIYVPIILFYPAAVSNSKHHDDLDLLKSSLSETLAHFYPMAGRMKDNIMVDCNDEGIDFLEVKIKGKMCDFMTKPDVPLSLLLPSDVVSMNFVREAQVVVQVNMFDCGGTAICLCVSHKIADACTISTFIRNWAATTNSARCRGANIVVPTTNQNVFPSFDSASLFPPSEQLVYPSGLPPILPYPTEDNRGDKVVTKRFVFDAVKITSVREKLQVLMQDNYKYRRPTRVEVVSALIWKSVIKSAPAGSSSRVNHAVNFRRKMDPPLQDVSFGNLCVVATAVLAATRTATPTNKTVGSKSNEVQVALTELSEFVAQLRGEIDKVKGDKGCMEKIALNFFNGYDAIDASNSVNDNVRDEAIALWMVSWCNFGLYDADFGWGKPIWVTTDPFIEQNKNIVYMNDTKCGQGIEVWVKFLEDDMAKFELNLSEILDLI